MLEFNFVYGDMGYEICKSLRDEIFGAELSDGKEGESYHFVGYDKLVQIGVARLRKITDESYEIAYVGLKDGYRRQYVGDLVMKALADKAQRMGAKEAFVTTPIELIPFFEYEDYEKVGEAYAENGKKLIKMRIDLTYKHKCRGCKG